MEKPIHSLDEFGTDVRVNIEKIGKREDHLDLLKRAGEALAPPGFEYGGTMVCHVYTGSKLSLFEQQLAFATQLNMEKVSSGVAKNAIIALEKKLISAYAGTEEKWAKLDDKGNVDRSSKNKGNLKEI